MAKPYFAEHGISIYHGDARDLVGSVITEAIITDPVWPNSIFQAVTKPQELLSETLAASSSSTARVVIHLGGDSDPRFLMAVPDRFKFFRSCHLEYCNPSYKGRLLYTADMAYAFGDPPAAAPGRMVIPGKCLATVADKSFQRGTGRKKHKSKTDPVYIAMAHPCPRRLQHVRWLCKWFAGASVCDPFMGTGTTAVACKLMQIPFVGIEIEERYCEMAVERLRQGQLELEEMPA